MWLWSQAAGVRVLVHLTIGNSCVTLVSLLKLSGPPFTQWWNGNKWKNRLDNKDKVFRTKPASGKHSRNASYSSFYFISLFIFNLQYAGLSL